MAGIFSFDRERVRREAADWFARLHAPDGETARDEFRSWYERDPAHSEAFDRIERHWQASRLLAPRANRGLAASALAGKGPARPRYAIAAAVAGTVAVSSILAVSSFPPFVEAGRAQDIIFETGIGEIRHVALGDGSRLTLDTQSRVEVHLDSGERVLKLERGRIRVDARPDARPLILVAGQRVEILEAETLDAMVENGRLDIAAVEGRLRFRQAGGAARLIEPGSRIGLTPGRADDGPSPIVPVDSGWTSGILDFESVPMGQAVERANRYSAAKLVVADPGLAAERVTGRFRAGDVEGLANSLAAAFNLEVSRGPGREYRLARKRPDTAPWK